MERLRQRITCSSFTRRYSEIGKSCVKSSLLFTSVNLAATCAGLVVTETKSEAKPPVNSNDLSQLQGDANNNAGSSFISVKVQIEVSKSGKAETSSYKPEWGS